MKITKFFALMCAAAVAFVGCEGTEDNNNGGTTGGGNNNPPASTTGFVLSVDKTPIALGESFTLTVTDDGVDVTSSATIYNYKSMEVVKNNTFTPESTGVYSFFATLGSKSSNTLYVTVMASVPDLPADTDAANTKFNHRILLVDHTGVNCGYCPMMTDNLLALHETEWKDHFNEVTNHAGAYASGDPANSPAANIVDAFYGSPGSKPKLNINFYYGEVPNQYVSGFISDMNTVFTELVKVDGADAGAAVATVGDPEIVYATVAVKAAVEQEYKVNAWLLQNNIYSANQANASEPHHYIYNHAVRNIAGSPTKTNVQGESIGVVKAGDTFETGFELPITSTKWELDNLEVLVIISAKDRQNRWEVVNTTVCPVNQSVNFEYLQ
ncbi:MAG: Omp28-related outer membrane protein [Alistipes sp.]|nr:Omp28-related outer membrane protein [Alistipes sp.]